MKTFLVIVVCLAASAAAIDEEGKHFIDYRLVSNPTDSFLTSFTQPRVVTCTAQGKICDPDCQRIWTCINKNGQLEPALLQTCQGKQTCNNGTCSDNPSPECSLAPNLEFSCQAEGVFPDPRTCKKYHYCIEQEGNGGGGGRGGGSTRNNPFSTYTEELGGSTTNNPISTYAEELGGSTTNNPISTYAEEIGGSTTNNPISTYAEELGGSTTNYPISTYAEELGGSTTSNPSYAEELVDNDRSCTYNRGYNPRTTYCDKVLVNDQCGADYPVPICKTPGQHAALKDNTSIFYVCSLYNNQGDVLYPYLYLCKDGTVYDGNYGCK